METIDAPFLDGWFAHKGKFGPMAPTNPYSPHTQAYSHSKWQAGYAHRYNAIKHDLPLDHDDKL